MKNKCNCKQPYRTFTYHEDSCALKRCCQKCIGVGFDPCIDLLCPCHQDTSRNCPDCQFEPGYGHPSVCSHYKDTSETKLPQWEEEFDKEVVGKYVGYSDAEDVKSFIAKLLDKHGQEEYYRGYAKAKSEEGCVE